MLQRPVPAVVGLMGQNRQVICNYVFWNGGRTLCDCLEVKLCALGLPLAATDTQSVLRIVLL